MTCKVTAGRDDQMQPPNATTKCECDDMLMRRLVYTPTGYNDRMREQNVTTDDQM